MRISIAMSLLYMHKLYGLHQSYTLFKKVITTSLMHGFSGLLLYNMLLFRCSFIGLNIGPIFCVIIIIICLDHNKILQKSQGELSSAVTECQRLKDECKSLKSHLEEAREAASVASLLNQELEEKEVKIATLSQEGMVLLGLKVHACMNMLHAVNNDYNIMLLKLRRETA